MGHLTLRMIGILIVSFLVFGLAQAENLNEQERQEQEQENQKEKDTEKEKKRKAEERFRAEQSIKRALRDQGRSQGPVLPVPPPRN